MYNVSNDYKTQIRKSLRNFSHMRIKFGIVDPDAIKNVTVTDDGKLVYSTEPDINDSLTVSNRYGTLEPGFWILDGSYPVYNSEQQYQGFVSNKIGSATITFSFAGGYYSFRGIGMKFDAVSDEYPLKVNILAYRDNAEVFNKIVTIDKADFQYSGKVPELDQLLNKLVITVMDTRLPNRRVRMEAVTLGVKKFLYANDIVSTEWTRQNNLLSTVIPANEFQFTFFDPFKEYNPDNPQGVWTYLESGQRVAFDYGYQLDDGSIEWIPGGIAFTDGNPSITNSGYLPQVSFKSMSRLQQLTQIYSKGIYSSAGATLYDLAKQVLQFAGIVDSTGTPEYTIDNSMKNYKTVAPLPILEVRALLQLLANAGMCILIVDRQGWIHFKKQQSLIENFKYDYNSIYDNAPTITKYPFLKMLSTKVHTYKVSIDTTELIKLEIKGAINTKYTLQYGEATNVTFSTSTGLSIVGAPEVYATNAVVVLTGDGTITISGKAIDQGSYDLNVAYDVIGEDCELDNQLITDKAHCLAYNSWVASILNRRKAYSFSDRGFPEVDETDNIIVDTAYADITNATITKSSIKYNGALRGETEVLGI